MKIAFFHGLESDGPGQKGAFLETVASSLYAPTVDYRNPDDVRRVWGEAIAFQPDVVVGSSMGGWFGLHLCMELGVVGAFVNPAVVGRTVELELELKHHNAPPIFLLLGLEDEQVPYAGVREWFGERNMAIGIDYIRVGHRVPIEDFQKWWEGVAAQRRSLVDFENSELHEKLADELKLGRPELALAEAVLRHFPKIDALCAYSGGGLPRSLELTHERWLSELDVMESQLVAVEQAAKAKQIELQSLRQELAEQEEAIDWKNPRIRNRIKKSMQSIVSVGSVRGSTDRYSPVKLLPKLTPILYHRMVAFYQDDLHTLGRKNGSKKWDPVEELVQHRMEWMGVDQTAPRGPGRLHFKSMRTCRLMFIPKHVDGKATYALTAESGYGHGLIRNLHFWVATPDGSWAYDGMKQGKLERL